MVPWGVIEGLTVRGEVSGERSGAAAAESGTSMEGERVDWLVKAGLHRSNHGRKTTGIEDARCQSALKVLLTATTRPKPKAHATKAAHARRLVRPLLGIMHPGMKH